MTNWICEYHELSGYSLVANSSKTFKQEIQFCFKAHPDIPKQRGKRATDELVKNIFCIYGQSIILLLHI